jgi:metal-sulfur cluster biosynthetic enzyme
MNFYKKTAFTLLSLLIISCGKMRSEDESNTDLDTVQQTEIDNINSPTTQNNDSMSESDSLHQTATKGSILGEAKFKKKPKDSTAVQTNNTNTSNAVTETKSPSEDKTNSPNVTPKKAVAPSKYNIQKILNGCAVGETLTQEELSKNLSIPKDAIKLVKSITKISDNEIDVKWNSTWAVEKISDAEFEDGRIKAVFKNNKLYISGGAIGIRYNRKTYTNLEVVGRSAHIPSVKGFYWQIGRD